MKQLITTAGDLSADEVELVLPHEHVFVDFRVPQHPEHGVAEVDDVVAVMAPEVARAKAQGVTAMVDCTPVGVGRRPDIVRAVADAAGMPTVLPTGLYREPWVPDWAYGADEAEIADWMLAELQEGIEGARARGVAVVRRHRLEPGRGVRRPRQPCAGHRSARPGDDQPGPWLVRPGQARRRHTRAVHPLGGLVPAGAAGPRRGRGHDHHADPDQPLPGLRPLTPSPSCGETSRHGVGINRI
nr:hypothetical protein [Aestuariimicrobium ganziense]